MQSCKTQIDLLREEVGQDIWTFRWLWFLNLAAVVWGIVVRHYDVVVISGVSALVAIFGVGRTRRGRRLVERAMNACVPSHFRRTESEGPQESPQ